MRGLRSTALGGAAVLAAAAALASPLMTTAATAGSIQVGDHQVVTVAQEKHVVVGPETTVTESIRCADGYFATSGGFLVDAVDDGQVGALFVLTSQTTDGVDWKVIVRNDNDTSAQGKLKVSCVQGTTTVQDGHAHGFAGALATPQTATLSTADEVITQAAASCASGIPVAAGWSTTAAVLLRSAEAGSGAYTFGFEALESGHVTVTGRCLMTTLTSAGEPAHTHAVAASNVTKAVELEAGTSDVQVACPDGAVAIGGSFSGTDVGVTYLGGDPRGTQRSFRFLNDFDDKAAATIGATCLAAAPVAPAPTQKITASAPMKEWNGGKKFRTMVTCVFKCTVKVTLTPRGSNEVKAVGTATIAAGGTKKVVLNAKGSKAAWVDSAKLATLNFASGKYRGSQEITIEH